MAIGFEEYGACVGTAIYHTGNLALTEKSVSFFFPGFFFDAVFVLYWTIVRVVLMFNHPSFDFGVMYGVLPLKRNHFVVEDVNAMRDLC